MTYTKISAATCSTPQLSAFLQGFRDQSLTREPYYNDVRRLLSRRAKAFLMLLEGQLSDNVMEYVTRELASEARRDQNMLVQQLFNILIEAEHVSYPEDERLSLKLDELAEMVCINIDLSEDHNYDD